MGVLAALVARTITSTSSPAIKRWSVMLVAWRASTRTYSVITTFMLILRRVASSPTLRYAVGDLANPALLSAPKARRQRPGLPMALPLLGRLADALQSGNRAPKKCKTAACLNLPAGAILCLGRLNVRFISVRINWTGTHSSFDEQKKGEGMSDITTVILPGLPLLLCEQRFDAGTGESGLLNGLVSNIDRRLVGYTLR